MARKDFAMISTSLPYSRKYRAGSILAKLVYNHLHYSSAANYLGIFQYQDVVLAHEIDIALSDLNGALGQLEANGLIEQDQEAEIIRIVGWFNKANGAMNAKHATGIIRDFENLDIPDCQILYASVSEFVVNTLKRGMKWKKDSENIRTELKPFLNRFLKDNGREFALALLGEIKTVGSSLQSEIHSLVPSLLEYEPDTVSIPYAYNNTTLHDTKPTLNKTDTYTETSASFENDSDQPLIEDQEADVVGFRKKGTKPKRPPVLASEAAKQSALARGGAA